MVGTPTAAVVVVVIIVAFVVAFAALVAAVAGKVAAVNRIAMNHSGLLFKIDHVSTP